MKSSSVSFAILMWSFINMWFICDLYVIYLWFVRVLYVICMWVICDLYDNYVEIDQYGQNINDT